MLSPARTHASLTCKPASAESVEIRHNPSCRVGKSSACVSNDAARAMLMMKGPLYGAVTERRKRPRTYFRNSGSPALVALWLGRRETGGLLYSREFGGEFPHSNRSANRRIFQGSEFSRFVGGDFHPNANLRDLRGCPRHAQVPHGLRGSASSERSVGRKPYHALPRARIVNSSRRCFQKFPISSIARCSQ